MSRTGKAISIDVYILLAIFLQPLTVMSLMDEIEWARKVCNATKEEIGRSNPKDSRIVGGQIANGGVKYQVGVLHRGHFTCGGAIISPDWVLTAAHCVHKRNTTEISTTFRVVADIIQIDQYHGQQRDVIKVKPHPNYSPNPLIVNDIALLKVNQPFDFNKGKVESIQLPTKSTPLEGDASISGFGCTQFDFKKCRGGTDKVLRRAEVPLWSTENCVKAWISSEQNMSTADQEELKTWLNNYVCAGGKHVGSCSGDSGGPLVVMENKRPVVIGVTSFGYDHMCGCDGVPVTYTKVLNYLKWIQDVQDGKDTSGHLLANVILVILQLAYLWISMKLGNNQ